MRLEEHSGTTTMADSAVGSKQLTFTLQKVNGSCADPSEMRPLGLIYQSQDKQACEVPDTVPDTIKSEKQEE